MTLLIVSIFCMVCASFMTKTGVLFWIGVVKVIFFLLKWAIVIGMISGIVNSTYMYNAIGFTPISVLVGPHIYDDTKKPTTNIQKKPTTRKQYGNKRTEI